MSPVNLENFVMQLFMDTVEAGDPIPDKPGWVQLPDSSLCPEYRQVRAYNEAEFLQNSTALDPSDHGAAYDIAMVALLHFRKYWIETSEWVEEKRPEEVLGSMGEDLQNVIEHLVTIRNALKVLEKGEPTLINDIKTKEEAQRKSKLLLQQVQAAENKASTELNSSIWARDLFRVLNEGPVEQLARVAESQPTSTEAQEPEANV
jgi:hypothetical protein